MKCINIYKFYISIFIAILFLTRYKYEPYMFLDIQVSDFYRNAQKLCFNTR